MKILSISAQKPHSTGSGVYLTELVKGFHRLGMQQAVIAGVYGDDSVEFPSEVEFFPVYYKTKQLPFPIPGMSDEMPYESSIYSELKSCELDQMRKNVMGVVKRVMKEWQPDIILCHHVYLMAAWVREEYPDAIVVGISHGTDVRQMIKTDLERMYIREQILKLDKVFTLHGEIQGRVQKIYGCTDEQMQVIGIGYNNEIFHVRKCLNNIRIKENDKRVIRLVFAGKIAEKKGVMSLLRALENVEDRCVELRLAGGYGNIEEYQEILQLAQKCNKTVYMLGMLSQEQLSQEFQRSDIFVLPSFYEGLPLVIIEALACGMHVISTDLPGVQSWLNQCIPLNDITFVEPPVIQNADEVVYETLPAFERRLGRAIGDVVKMVREESDNDREEILTSLQGVSWQGVSETICKSLDELLKEKSLCRFH